MKTFKIDYTVPNQPGHKITFVQAANEYDARQVAYREFGGFGSITIWSVIEVKL